MTPRTPGGRFGKALSDASTAPTSAEGLFRQRMSREIVNSVPVPSESEAIGLGHGGQDVSVSALGYWRLLTVCFYVARANQCAVVPQRPRSSTVRMAPHAGGSLSECFDFDVDRADGWTRSSDS
jgi:hypothetical protein